MPSTQVDKPETQSLLDRVAGLDQSGGTPRVKAITRRIVGDLYATIDAFDVSPEEFWGALHYLQGAAPEFGLIAPGLGFDHFLDVRMDAEDAAAGVSGGTPRTIEGPLYVPGAPQSDGFARLDDGSDSGDALVIHGKVLDQHGAAVAGAVVDVWHANTAGGYSHFDPTQKPFAYRRSIRADADGRYKFQSIVPSGYAVPPGGSTEKLLDALGRHGRRPAHIHFFVSAPGYRHLTTQINIAGDPDLYDDFAYATRDGLIPAIARRDGGSGVEGIEGSYAEIVFDFELVATSDAAQAEVSKRPRAEANA